MSDATFEGELVLDVPAAGKPCKTWYKVFGDLRSSAQRPLVLLHGGPGCCHDYLLPYVALATERGIPLVFYDQIGCGRSTHLREKAGDASFWTEDLFVRELEALITHLGIQDNYAILGHSWGGMLGSRFATMQPQGLRALVLASSLASSALWMEAAKYLITQLPASAADAINRHEAAGTTDNPEYLEATRIYYERHLCRVHPFPEGVVSALKAMEEDPTVYHTMEGTSEFNLCGTLKDWSVVDQIHKIRVPTLLLNGEFDEARDSVIKPFWDKIEKVKWYTFPGGSHMGHFEDTEKYVQIVGDFLAGVQ